MKISTNIIIISSIVITVSATIICKWTFFEAAVFMFLYETTLLLSEIIKHLDKPDK